MGKLWIPVGGGAGSGSDDCTASKAEVLKGYSAITSDSDDETVQGTLELTADAADGQVLSGKTYYNTNPKSKRTGSMTNQGAVSIKLNAGEGYTVPSGFHNGGGKVEANSLASQTGGTATAAHILSGQTAWVNGAKVNGGIPWQNAEIGGTDRAWSQGYSNWAGTINLRVRNGHYLNGVNWIEQDIPEYQPWNIKKGVNIGGVVGTFEGYIPGSTDLYYRGSNPANWSSAGGWSFQAGQIFISGADNAGEAAFSTVGKSYLNIEGSTHGYGGQSEQFWELKVRINSSWTTVARVAWREIGYYTKSINLNAAQVSGQFRLVGLFTQDTIYRIWLS
jgi:hypothetical protein